MPKRLVLLGDRISLDIHKLVPSRLLIQANSGGGKSRMLRRLLEQSNGAIQQIVIDVEGEFVSLRKRFDYVVASKHGDTPADPRGAAMLAERLLELKVSAIIDLYELRHPSRIEFVKLFLDAMINAPKALWHPVLVVIDEAHIFCPQVDEAASSDAVKDLCTRGRKRGFCAVLATQRLSKLHKDAAAECNNKLIGRAMLDVDLKRASYELGFTTAEQQLTLRTLKPGEFYAFGPAFNEQAIVRFRGGPVLTSHPKAGSRFADAAPRPSARVRRLLPKLADLPAEAEQREASARELKQEARQAKLQADQLTRKVAQLEAHMAASHGLLSDRDHATLIKIGQQIHSIDDGLRAGYLTQLDRIGKTIETSTYKSLAELIERAYRHAHASHDKSLHAFERHLASRRLRALLAKLDAGIVQPAVTPTKATPVARPVTTTEPADVASTNGDRPSTRGRAGNADARILAVIKQRPGITRDHLGPLAGISARKSTFRITLGRLIRQGLIERDPANPDGFQLTAAGAAATVDIEAPPTGPALLTYWRDKLGSGAPRRLFDALASFGHDGAGAVELAELAKIDRVASTYRLAVGKLRHMGLVDERGERLSLTEQLADAIGA